MNDTHPKVAQFLRERLMRLSGVERMQLGAGAYDSARSMVAASLAGKGSEDERLLAMARRFYGELGVRAVNERIRRAMSPARNAA